ncbi:putative LOB domain-containing protein 2-like [Capsicum annuum]|nr:putative LOB domain-containing protein 2-like [Capsicum annuum]
MDLKAISWVGNVYQKFETMCLEMEEAMYQDTVKYVENQVNIVGTNVKRFYSEVMQDVHPQCSIDPVKVAAADLSLNPYAHYEIDKKLKANLKGSDRGFSNKLNDDTQVIKGKIKSGGVYKRQNVGIKEIVRDSHPAKKSDTTCLASGDAVKSSSHSEVRGGFEMASDHVTLTSPLASVKGSDSGQAASKVCDHIVQTNVPAADTSINSAASVMMSVESDGKKQIADTCTKELARNTRLEISCNSWNNELANEEINELHEEKSDNLSSSTSKYVNIESELELVENFDESQLEETCVLVEKYKIRVPHGPAKLKSYKKKLREAFSTKKRLTRKEYEQLGALYGDQQCNLEAEDRVMPVLAMNSNTKMLSANDHPESEWEIL